MFTITVLPFFPREALAQPREILQKIQEFSYPKNGYREFLDLNQDAIPEGMMHFKHNYDGYIESQQVYSKGLIYSKLDVLQVNENNKRIVYLSYIVGRSFAVLKAAKMFYQVFGYQGSIKINTSLNGVRDVYLSEIRPDGFLFFGDGHEGLLQDYSWDLNIDIRDLNDDTRFKQFFYQTIKEMYWDLGFKELSEQVFNKFLEQSRLS